MKKKILVVEDEFIEANNLQRLLEKAGYCVTGIARTVAIALGSIEKERPDLVLLDIFLQGDLTGIDLAKMLRQKGIGFVYLSANSNQATLDEAKITKPYGFLVKPFREKDLLVTLDIAWYLHAETTAIRQNQENVLKQKLHADKARPVFEKMVGAGAAFLFVLEQLTTVAGTDTSVLLLGESGTGKERVAKYIHEYSRRREGPMIIVNCAALPASLIESELFGHEKGSFTGATEKRIGKFEQAAGGTIFLDEIGEMPKDMQVKLLRVLQEKEFDRIGGSTPVKANGRIIAATNRNLEKEVAEGRFRLDLYYRLNVFPITLPPLRERKEDIPELAEYFLQQFAKRTAVKAKKFSPEAIAQMQQHNWPGNIRELENLVERATLLATGEIIQKLQLPENIAEAKVDKSFFAEREEILSAIKKCNGRISGAGGAAELLNMPATTLHSKMKKMNIKTVYR